MNSVYILPFGNSFISFGEYVNSSSGAKKARVRARWEETKKTRKKNRKIMKRTKDKNKKKNKFGSQT